MSAAVKDVDVKFRPAPNALDELQEISLPYLEDCGEIIGREIVAAVPVHDGIAVQTYNPTVDRSGDEVRVFPNSPFWHWLEYGTNAHERGGGTPAFRPVARGVEASGARWEPS